MPSLTIHILSGGLNGREKCFGILFFDHFKLL